MYAFSVSLSSHRGSWALISTFNFSDKTTSRRCEMVDLDDLDKQGILQSQDGKL